MGERLSYYRVMPEEPQEVLPLIDRDPELAMIKAQGQVVDFYEDHGKWEEARKAERKLYSMKRRHDPKTPANELAAYKYAESGVSTEDLFKRLLKDNLPKDARAACFQLFEDKNQEMKNSIEFVGRAPVIDKTEALIERFDRETEPERMNTMLSGMPKLIIQPQPASSRPKASVLPLNIPIKRAV